MMRCKISNDNKILCQRRCGKKKNISIEIKLMIIIVIKTYFLMNCVADSPQSKNIQLIQFKLKIMSTMKEFQVVLSHKYVWNKLTWHLSNRSADQMIFLSLTLHTSPPHTDNWTYRQYQTSDRPHKKHAFYCSTSYSVRADKNKNRMSYIVFELLSHT